MVSKPLVSIVSAGSSKFGRQKGVYGRELFAEAAREAIERCPNLDLKRDVKALFVGHMSESFENFTCDFLGLLIPFFEKSFDVCDRLIKVHIFLAVADQTVDRTLF